MVSLAGLSATYPGYLKADEQSTVTDINKMKLLDAQTQQAGQQAFGNTIKMFQSQVPGAQPMQQGPQAPMPGQASVPQQPSPSMQGGQPPTMQRGQPPTMQGGAQQPQGSMAPQGGGMGQGAMDWRQIATAVAKANPGAPPEVIAAAVTQFLPLMNAQAQMEWKQYALGIQKQRADTSERQGDERIQEARDRERRIADQFAEKEKRLREQFSQKEEDFKSREARLAINQNLLRDQGYQRLKLQQEALEERRARGDRTATLQEIRATIDLQHKRALEVISSQAVMLPKQERDKLLAEQKKAYDDSLNTMRDKFGSATPTGSKPTEGGTKTPDRVRKYNPATGAIE